MSNPKRAELGAEARRRSQEQFARVGGELKSSRRRRRLTQAQLGERAGLSQSGVSLAERGFGGSLSMFTWQRLLGAVERRLIVEASRDSMEDVVDAGHLAIQELMLQVGRAAGYTGTFELPTRAARSRHSSDVALRSDRRRVLLLVEVWNSFTDLGASVRATSRKAAEAEAVAIAVGGDRPYRVATCWVVRSTARNRALVSRYPAIFGSRFPASSAAWVDALARGTPPPGEPGLVWCDVAATRIFAWRQTARASDETDPRRRERNERRERRTPSDRAIGPPSSRP